MIRTRLNNGRWLCTDCVTICVFPKHHPVLTFWYVQINKLYDITFWLPWTLSIHPWLIIITMIMIVCIGVVNCHSQVNFLWKLHHLHFTNTIIPTLLTHTEVFFDLGQCVCIKGHIIDFHTHSEPTVCLTDRDRVLLFQPCASALVYISFLCRKEKCTSNPYRPAYTYCKMLYALAQLCQADEWWLKLIIFFGTKRKKFCPKLLRLPNKVLKKNLQDIDDIHVDIFCAFPLNPSLHFFAMQKHACSE